MFFLILSAVVYVGVKYQQHYSSRFIDIDIKSNALAEMRRVFIRLPKDYNPNKAYPLIIKTDGNFNLDTWDDALSIFESTDDKNKVILVAIPNLFWHDTRNRDLVPPYARKDVAIKARPLNQNQREIFGKADVFLKFIETELLPYLEGTYRISGQRTLTGFSAGGSFVLYTMVTKPELFNAYFAFSPAAWYDDNVVVKQFSKSLPNTAGNTHYFYVTLGGDENPTITGAFNGLVNVLQKHAPNDLTWQHHINKGADHEQNAKQSVRSALDGAFNHFDMAQ
jgi:hypothetical protein